MELCAPTSCPWASPRPSRARHIRADDPEASAAVLLASLTYYPILNVLIGHSPGDVNADRFAETWVQHAAATLGN